MPNDFLNTHSLRLLPEDGKYKSRCNLKASTGTFYSEVTDMADQSVSLVFQDMTRLHIFRLNGKHHSGRKGDISSPHHFEVPNFVIFERLY